jgi:hypothetical protein
MSGIDQEIFRQWDLIRQGINPSTFTGRTLHDIAHELNGYVKDGKVWAKLDDLEFAVTRDAYVYYTDPGLPLHRVIAYLNDRGLQETSKKSPEERKADALLLWDQCVSPTGTPVELYLRSRCLHLIPDDIKFHPEMYHRETKSHLPAMVALVRDANGHPTAIHRTFLDPLGRKAAVDPLRKSMGVCTGSAIHLAPAAEEIGVGEGIETCLSIQQQKKLPCWAALSAIGMTQVVLPPIVKSVIVLVDGDKSGRLKSEEAGWRFKQQGVSRVRLLKAPSRKDFNDVLILMFKKKDNAQ